MEENYQTPQEGKPSYGYGKRPWWQWVLLYIVVGGIVYGAVYYIFFAKSGGYNYQAPQYQENSPSSTNQNSNSNGYPQENSNVNNPPMPTPLPSPTTSNSPPPAVSQQAAAIQIKGFTFNSNNITVRKGTKVTWTNNDAVPHTVTGDNGGPSSPYINPGGSYSYVFTTTGTFTYYCSIHTNMRGTVQVIN